MARLCDRVIVSANEHWLYMDFWPLVAYAYRAIFPESVVTLAFLTERLETDPFVAELRKHGKVELVKPERNIPQSAQAKLARYWVAMKHPNEVCYIDDLDAIPIDRDWHLSKTVQRKPGTMLFVGSEVYDNEPELRGQCPVSMMTAEGKIFSALFNPYNLPYDLWLNRLKLGTKTHINIESRTHHEGLKSTTDAETMGEAMFSDEGLIVALRKLNPIPVSNVRRDYVTGVDTIDRSQWDTLDFNRLTSGAYLTAHTGRPYAEHKLGNNTIMEYIRQRYGGGPLPRPLVKTARVDDDMVFGGSGMVREAFEWIVANVPLGSTIIELGSGHVSTNYLSRYYRVVSVENNREYVSLYPAHYIYAPLAKDGWFDIAALARGLDNKRVDRSRCALLIVDGPLASTPEARSGIFRQTLLPLDQAIIVDDTRRDGERAIAEKLSFITGRAAVYTKQYAVIA